MRSKIANSEISWWNWHWHRSFIDSWRISSKHSLLVFLVRSEYTQTSLLMTNYRFINLRRQPSEFNGRQKWSWFHIFQLFCIFRPDFTVSLHYFSNSRTATIISRNNFFSDISSQQCYHFKFTASCAEPHSSMTRSMRIGRFTNAISTDRQQLATCSSKIFNWFYAIAKLAFCMLLWQQFYNAWMHMHRQRARCAVAHIRRSCLT